MKLPYLFILLALMSCKKELDPIQSVVGSSEFFLNGSLNDTTFNYYSGCNNYYMETDFARQTSNTANSPYTLKGYLSPKDCVGCANSVTIMVTSYNQDTVDANFNIDSVFYVGRKIRVSSDSNSNLDVNKINHALVMYSSPNLSSLIYYSSAIVQHSFMTIKSVQPFGLNSKGQKTVKVSFDIECKVSDFTYTHILDLNMSGSFAFAYPS